MTPKTPAKASDTGTDLVSADYEARLAAANADQAEEIDSDLLSTPILKIGQPLTREVQDELAEVGEFINTATKEGIGDKVDFIVAYYQKGRFAADRETNKAYVAFSSTIPDHWEPLVGPEWVGTPFSEYPDAEEKYRYRANVTKEIKWGKGPLVSTTHNFTGFVLVDDGSGNIEAQPVRLSLQRTNVPAVKDWVSLKQTKLRNRPWWDKTFELSTYKKSFDKGTAYLLKVAVGRDTTPDEKLAALDLSELVREGRVQDNSVADGADAPVEPDAKGGLGV